MSQRDELLTQIREAIADDPDIVEIRLRPELLNLLGLLEIDGVRLELDTNLEHSTRIH